MNLKPQDVVVALKFVSDHSASGYSEKATALGMSVSEVHGASKRALRAQLLVEQGGRIVPMVRNLTEFLVHGIRYVFPPDSGGLGRGMPTGFEAPPVQHLAGSLIEKDFPRVWADPEGTARGEIIEPLYPSVPGAARRDERLYLLLALVDELRVGRAREREQAASLLREHLKGWSHMDEDMPLWTRT